MPVIPSVYQAPWILRQGHAHTVYPVLCRKVTGVGFVRQRLELDDKDFLDLDWARVGGSNVVIVVHGLEGSSRSGYVRGMVRAFNRRGWDAVVMNFRGCSGEPNRLLKSYHSGASDDLGRVAESVAGMGYQGLGLIGFSLGGNVTLKYLGELGATIPPWLLGGVAISVPCDLRSSAQVMARPENRLYMGRFLVSLRAKLRARRHLFPEALDDSGYGEIKTFREFDNRYTAPIHGFRDAEDYWARCSSLAFLEAIRCPTLLLNAADDPFLGPDCFPRDIAARHSWLALEIPRHGGHVGFVGRGLRRDEYYSERRALEFLAPGSQPAPGGMLV